MGALNALRDAVEEAFELLSGSELDGSAPDGVYDLETGGRIDVEFGAPVISRAKVQGVSP